MASNESDTQKILNPSGSLMIDRAASFASELSAALASTPRLLISLSGIEDLDLACLQVLYAARRSAAAAGKELHFVGTVSSRVVRRLAAAGFLRGSPERAEDFEAALTDFQ